MKYILYGNGGSGNHGCEAIIRGTQQVLKGDYIIQSQSFEEDTKYSVNAEISPQITGKKSKLKFINAYLNLKLFKDYTALDGIEYLDAIEKVRGKAEVALSVGGDNYCYKGTSNHHQSGFRYHIAHRHLWKCDIMGYNYTPPV